MKRKSPKWRVDWHGTSPPEVGQIVARLSPTNVCSHARVTGVRVIANRTPLPPGAVCRYLISIEPIDPPEGAEIAWTCHAYPRKRITHSSDPFLNRMSPLL